MSPAEILTTYWGYKEFRPLQEEIISSVLDGKDTLALLPTGGGKSICFQVPALVKEGICIVVSPLIALMKDQVENLRKKNIRAAAVFSGMSRNEIDITLDNCIYGNYKFLYISPERLQTDIFRIRFRKMKPNLIAVDEAHCISQWGYDFRPPYLHIAELREIHPDVPFLALTATATLTVRKDIQEKLAFTRENIFVKSFERKNLSYVVLNDDDKFRRMTEVFKKVPGSGIVYARNRKKTKEIAEQLSRNGIRSDYYHAGLKAQDRNKKQDEWIQNKTRVIVATNAFGMGIDKPDVRTVVHMDVPESVEAYYQEAGRAGRDEKPAYAVLLFGESDKRELETRIETSFPPHESIRATYHALCNYLKVPVGNAGGVSFSFNISDFCRSYNMVPITVHSALKILEANEYIALSDVFEMTSRIHIKVTSLDLYNFQVQHPNLDRFLKTILRSYGGVFDDFVAIREKDIAKREGISEEQVIIHLRWLQKLDLLDYEEQNDMPQLVFLQPRVAVQDLVISKKSYEHRKKQFTERCQAIIHYAEESNTCRSRMLLGYFGEETDQRCGTCDYCRQRNRLSLNDLEYKMVHDRVKELLLNKTSSFENLVAGVNLNNNDKTIQAIQWMMDNDLLVSINGSELKWNE